VFLLDIALFQFPGTNPSINWVPFRSMINDWRTGGWEFVINFLGNVVAFLPIGLLPPLIRRRRTTLRQMALFSLAISLTIEVGQFVSGRRVPDVDDLILNTLGGVAGYLASRKLTAPR
jgi:glycopeptide antibiotics resistance protein